ncbi:MAG: phosphotransferase family protein [Bacteroidales bacterium]|nr:phosphotransferase family protein [Bacteroidales bacterium]
MNIEDYIVYRVNALLHNQDAKIVKRLEGGMSNYTFVVESKGKKYTYRVPGKYAEKFVDRVEEWNNIQEVCKLGINNETNYVEILSGEKLAEYVEGTIMSDTDVVSYNEMSVKALKQLHNSDLKFGDYNAFKRLDDYERFCRETGFTHPEKYLFLRSKMEEMRRAYAQVKLVPCHCDYQPTNLVISGEKLYVLDWEYAGMNDPFYDIACYGNAGFDKALSLLETYVGHKPTSDELRRLYFHRAFQCLQWYNVAIFKDRIGLSKDLNMDFNQVALMFMGMAEDLVNTYDSL